MKNTDTQEIYVTDDLQELYEEQAEDFSFLQDLIYKYLETLSLEERNQQWMDSQVVWEWEDNAQERYEAE